MTLVFHEFDLGRAGDAVFARREKKLFVLLYEIVTVRVEMLTQNPA